MHFALAVFTEEGGKSVEELLKPLYSDLEVEEHIGRTKQEMIEEAKEYKNIFKQRGDNSDFAKQYLEAETDEELYQAEYRDYKKYDENGNELTTYNPNAKWDWYDLCGRYCLYYENKVPCFTSKVKELSKSFFSYAVLLPDGTWIENDGTDDWKEKYKERFIDSANPEWTLTIVDCHI